MLPVQSEQRPFKVFMQRCPFGIRLRNAIEYAFTGDEELVKYHIAPKVRHNLMARHTFLAIGASNRHKGSIMRSYAVYIKYHGGDTHLIGFTVLCQQPVPILFSFGIKKEFRQKDILIAWLGSLEKKFEGKPYAVTLNMKNTRAIMFFERNGFVQTAINKKSKTVALCRSLEESAQPSQ